MTSIIQNFQKRRSIYSLSDNIPISDKDVKTMIEECIIHAPSAFNSQSGRVVLLLNDEHKKLWEIVLTELAKVTPVEKFTATELKISSFAAGYGTVLFFEDNDVINDLQEQYPLYKEAFPQYSCQSSGMLQYMIWTSLSAVDIGASLQHYNPLIDKAVKKQWTLPQSWHLMSQMPFGKIEKSAQNKTFLPIKNRLKIFE
jgi:predicted oxidoreductase (fatty acid repression mutant protein)